jgi:hypothetical protein
MIQYRVINKFEGEEFDRHEYDILVDVTDNGTKFSLKRSNSEHWSESHRGETVCALLDNGDGVKLSKHFSRDMDYAQFAEFYILLAFINKYEPNSLFQGVIETLDIVNIMPI